MQRHTYWKGLGSWSRAVQWRAWWLQLTSLPVVLIGPGDLRPVLWKGVTYYCFHKGGELGLWPCTSKQKKSSSHLQVQKNQPKPLRTKNKLVLKVKCTHRLHYIIIYIYIYIYSWIKPGSITLYEYFLSTPKQVSSINRRMCHLCVCTK